MPKKRFEDQPYNPIEADLARDAATMERHGGTRGNRPMARDVPMATNNSSHQRQTRHHRDAAGRSLPGTSKSEVAKRFTLTRDEDVDLTEFLQRLQRQSETRVALSLIIRAGLNLIMQAEPEILSQMRKSRPPNQPATHDSLSYAEFEMYWTQLIGEALRNTRPLA